MIKQVVMAACLFFGMRNKYIALLFLVAFPYSVIAADGDYLVRHGETVISREDVIRSIETYVPERSRADLLSNEKKLRDFVAQLFAARKLAEEAGKRELSSEERWKIDSAAERAATQIQLDYLVANGPVPNYEQAAYEFYLANPAKFADEERVRVEHILIGLNGRSKEEALARADEVLKEVKAGKSSFSELANAYSDDPSVKQNSGDLGYFGRGRMVKPFEDAAFAMKDAGDVVGPVESSFGFHIIRLVGRKPAAIKPFESVKEQLIKDEMLKHKRARVFAEYERVGKLPGIEVDQEAIKALVTPVQAGETRPLAN